MAWWALEKITTDTSTLRGRCKFNQLFTPPLFTSYTHTYTRTQKYRRPFNQIWDAIELISEIELRLEIGRQWLVLGKVLYMMLSYWLWSNITEQLKNLGVSSWKTDCLLKPSSSLFFTYFMSFPFLLFQQLHFVFFFFFRAHFYC